MRSARILALLAILALCPLAKADTVFNLSATINGIIPPRGYPPTSQATGTLTIDTVLGVVTGSTVQTSTNSFGYVNFTFSNGSTVDINLANQMPVFPFPNLEYSLDIVLPVSSLVGYTGGLGCSITYQPAPCPSIPPEVAIDAEAAGFVDTLSLIPAVIQTPELNSLVLLGTGLLGLVAPIRYRRRPSA
jgi:hypothetical protein